MRAVLKAHGVADRLVWVADSFAGLPPPNVAKYPQDMSDVFLASYEELAVSLEQVQANFRKYGLLDEQVRFLKGWFRDTLPHAPIKALAVLRDSHGIRGEIREIDWTGRYWQRSS